MMSNSPAANAGHAPQGASGAAPERRQIETAIAVLQQRFGDRVATGAEIRRQHAHTLTHLENQPPDAVVFAQARQDVVDVVEVARDHRVPIIPFGGGTSLEGHVNAPLGGISLDVAAMNQIVAVNERDLDCTVEAGVTRAALNTYLRDTGLFFAVDPGAESATLGGMASTRASGTCAVRYGTMRETVLSLTAVMADGSVVNTASRARKSAAGYDLTRLLVGAEGTLGIITDLTVRLYGIPEKVVAAVAPFETIDGACNATILAIQLGLGLARIELLDAMQIAAVNKYAHMQLAEKPTLFIEFHGTPAAVDEQVQLFKQIAQEDGAIGFDWAEREEDRRKLWKARHDALWAIKTEWPGRSILVTDVCVPISRLADCLNETQADIAEHGLTAPVAGHVGDGNFHLIIPFDAQDSAERDRVDHFTERLAHRAISMEGTCTGEHGIGQGKMALLSRQAGTGIEVMRAVKQALDPQNILNPGKIF